MKARRDSATLFIGGIPQQLSERDLREFALIELRTAGVPLNLLGNRIVDCKILRVIDPREGQPEHCALIEIRPARLARQVIAVLDGKCLAGRRIGLHRYRQRTAHPRAVGGAAPSSDGRERRRPNLTVEELYPRENPGLLARCRHWISVPAGHGSAGRPDPKPGRY